MKFTLLFLSILGLAASSIEASDQQGELSFCRHLGFTNLADDSECTCDVVTFPDKSVVACIPCPIQGSTTTSCKTNDPIVPAPPLNRGIIVEY